MTYREKLKADNPDWSDEAIDIATKNICPDIYGYKASNPSYCMNNHPHYCHACWSRQIPVPESVKAASERMAERLKAAKYEHSGEPIAKVKDIFEENGGITAVIEPIIKDSGDRTQFESGAVRDMREGKGRCDLMPLEVVCKLLSPNNCTDDPDLIIGSVALFMNRNLNTFYLYQTLYYFAERFYDGSIPGMFLEVAKHFEDGAKKYGENNWQKGIPAHCYIDSAVRHYLKWLRGDKDEPHDRAFVWNLMCCIWEVDYRVEENK